MNNYTLRRKLNGRFYFVFVGIGIVLALAVKVITDLAANKITTEDGEMSVAMRIFLIFMFLVVTSTYWLSFFNMLAVLIKNKGSAFTMSAQGVENCMTSMTFLAFVFVFRIKFIPWSALSDIHLSDGYLKATVDTRQVNANALAKLLLKLNGYRFGANFVSPTVNEGDIARFVG